MQQATAANPVSDKNFLNDVLDGLSDKQKSLPCKYFYDETGSQLFTQICETPEYYVTRAELAIMREHADDMAERIGENARIVEFGSGAGEKIRLLLKALVKPYSYTPLDISIEILQQSAEQLRTEFPSLMVTPVAADYTRPLADLPLFDSANDAKQGRKVVYFPGSTISNFTPTQAEDFLQQIAGLLESDGGLLIGVDTVKSDEILNAAYNDAAGVTAAFNKNLLHRINEELLGTFELDKFRHHAFFNRTESRIEMHLISEVDQTVSIAGTDIRFKAGESIHTENSYKYSKESLESLARKAGLNIRYSWSDQAGLFGVHYLCKG